MNWGKTDRAVLLDFLLDLYERSSDDEAIWVDARTITRRIFRKPDRKLKKLVKVELKRLEREGFVTKKTIEKRVVWRLK